MRKKTNRKRVFSKITLLVSAVLLMVITFHSCQQDEVLPESENVELKSDFIPEILLDYPDEVNAGEDFDITFSATCGRIMIERGFTAEVDEYGEIMNKEYTGLNCDMGSLLWEPVGENVFEDCGGMTITENLAEPGTYVYRAKLNFKAVKKSGCPDCGNFVGNLYECFTVTAVAGGGDENEGTFTDARDGHVYKWIKIGDQVWMAENMAYNMEGSYDFGDATKVVQYGRLYNHSHAVGGVAPEGWHVPSLAEWETLISYIEANPGLYGNVAKAMASKTNWYPYPIPGLQTPSSSQELNNSSGFNGLPAGIYESYSGVYETETYRASWWSSDAGSVFGPAPNSISLIFNYSTVSELYYSLVAGLSVRCVKDAE